MAPQSLFDLLHGGWAARAIQVATSLGIPDLLVSGPQPVSALAELSKTDADSLYRLLRALASIDVFVETEHRTFANSEFSTFLCSGQPGSLYHLARMMNAEWHWRPWGELEYSVRTGKPAFHHLYGEDRWAYFQRHPAEGQVFDLGISNFSHMVDGALAMAYDFSSASTVVDVSGGLGSLLAVILLNHPSLHGILFDRLAVIEEAKPLLARQPSLDGRCQFVSGDMFEAVPSGADVYIFKEIIHNWDDDQAIRILRNCRRAIAEHGRLLVADNVIRPGGKETSFSKFLDLEMLGAFPGRERTQAEFASIFEAAGFRFEQVILTRSPLAWVVGSLA